MFRVAVPAALLAATLLPVPAQAAAPPAFKVVKTTKLRGDDQLTQIIAPTRTSAFAFGQRGYRQTQPVAYHYDGRTWRRDALPKSVREVISGTSASSAKNVWAAVPGNLSVLNAYDPFKGLGAEEPDCPDPDLPATDLPTTDRSPAVQRLPLLKAARTAAANGRAAEQPSRLLRWNGKKWTVAKNFGSAAIADVVTRGPKDVWAFGLDRKGPASWHFNGRTWKRTATPGLVGGVVKGSGRTFWGISTDRTGQQLVRFDGRRWTKHSPKGIPPLVLPTKDTQGVFSFFVPPVFSAGRLHLTVLTVTGKACLDPDVTSRSYVGTGRSWRTVTVPKKYAGFSLDLPGIAWASDGRGGVVTLSTAFVRGEGTSPETRLFRLSAQGKWTSELVYKGRNGADYFGLAAVPGTSSFWAVGSRQGDWDYDGFVARKGKK